MTEKFLNIIEWDFVKFPVSRKQRIIIFTFSLLAIWVVMFVLNKYTPYTADDYCISPRIGEIVSIGDCFQGAYNGYFTWGGGVLNGFLQNLFGSLPSIIFDICNTSIFLLLILLVYYFIEGTIGSVRLSSLIFVFFSLIIFTPAFGQCFLWMDGSIPYMWMMLLGFSYLIPLRKQIELDNAVFSHPLLSFGYGILGIICCWSNITISVTVVALYLLKIVLYRKAYFWEICATIGGAIGFLFFYFAPGNFARGNAEGLVQHSNIVERFVAIFLHMFEWNCFLPLLLVSIIIIALGYVKMSKTILFLFTGFILIHFSMIGAPYYSDRVRIGPVLFAIMLCGHVLSKITISRPKGLLLKNIICLFLLISSAQALLKSKFDIMYFYNDSIVREAIILDQKATGEVNVTIPKPYVPITKYCGGYGLDNLTEDPNFWVNQAAAHYYGVNSIIVGTNTSISK